MTSPTILPSTDALENLRSVVAENLRSLQVPKILGTQLGMMLNTALSPDSYKTWLNGGRQNLRSFAEAFLQGIVTPTQERQGLDYLFQIDGNSQQITQSFGGALWKAFCTTRPSRTIFFDTKQNALFLLPVGNDEEVDAQVIASVSEHEHKEMCLRFVDLLDKEGRANQQLQDIAQAYETRSYPVWVSSLKAQPGLFKRWGVERFHWIKELFSQRIDAVTVEESTRVRLKADFEADHISQRKSKISSDVLQVSSGSAPVVHARSSANLTRQVLAKALDTLDDEQLAKILVPMDLVVALFAQHKH